MRRNGSWNSFFSPSLQFRCSGIGSVLAVGQLWQFISFHFLNFSPSPWLLASSFLKLWPYSLELKTERAQIFPQERISALMRTWKKENNSKKKAKRNDTELASTTWTWLTWSCLPWPRNLTHPSLYVQNSNRPNHAPPPHLSVNEPSELELRLIGLGLSSNHKLNKLEFSSIGSQVKLDQDKLTRARSDSIKSLADQLKQATLLVMILLKGQMLIGLIFFGIGNSTKYIGGPITRWNLGLCSQLISWTIGLQQFKNDFQ